MKHSLFVLFVLFFSFLSVVTAPLAQEKPVEEVYGQFEGKDVKIFTMRNSAGMEAKVTEYGATLVSLTAPDNNGKMADVTLGYDTLEGWLGNSSFFGVTAGRFANRIAKGEFTLDGGTYTLATNNEPGGIPCHLHGGEKGFDKVLWKGKGFANHFGQSVLLNYTSKDGEEGYPGTLQVEVRYLLTERNTLVWEAKATTDKPTVVNLAHHSYWNLSGDPTTSINGHELQIFADHYLPTNVGLIPTGEEAEVVGTPMDFREFTRIGKRVDEDFEALRFGGGYDHCWVLRGDKRGELTKAAVLRDPVSGRRMVVATNQPGMQFYGGNFLDGTTVGKGGVNYEKRTGLCLETQKYPDSPNQPAFPSTVLKPGEEYVHRMVHAFTTDKRKKAERAKEREVEAEE